MCNVAYILGFLLVTSRLAGSQVLDPISSIRSFINDGVEQMHNEPPDQLYLLKEYDVIIVGAGTAGCVLANRLSEIADWKILLIEAGHSENFVMDIPLIAPYLQFTPANWRYKTKPSDRYCAGFANKQCNWPRGKVVGGSSVLNFMIYTRGTSQDYDNWESMGNPGWGWDNVLHYFRKVENFNIPSFNNTKYHGYDGYLNVEHSPYRSPKAKAWVKAAQELGFKYGDHNGPDPSSVSFLQLSMKNGTRHSSSRAYLHPIHKRQNLHMAKASMVTKLIIDHTNINVIGVELIRNNQKYEIRAKKEVILSAGTVNSPQLLMLSGIGPKEHLKSLKIPVLIDLPVGYNLMDHIAAGGLTFVVDPQASTLNPESITANLIETLKWMSTHKGPMSMAGGCEALIFTELNDKFNSSGWPDLELLFITAGLNSNPDIPKNFGFDERILNDTYGPLGKTDTFTVFPMLMRPKSKGRLLLKSRNPWVHPTLIPNYFEYAEDVQTIVDGVKLAIEITKQPSMKKMGAKLYDNPIKECLKHGPFGSDSYFACHARMFTFTIYHQSGTCKMGPPGDPTAVVDPRLRVYGIKGLRVIDASIMPEVPSSHTNAPTYMVAEKGADLVKEDWGRSTYSL